MIRPKRINKGILYEQSVMSTLLSANISGLDIDNPTTSGFSANTCGDIQATLRGTQFNIEVKLNRRAQMGSSHLAFDANTLNILPHQNLIANSDPEYLHAVMAAAAAKAPALVAYIQELGTYNLTVSGFPLSIPRSIRRELTTLGFNKAIRTAAFVTTDHIVKHYNRKHVHYIQIGGAGLFYLGSNPLNLQIPAFEGCARAEIRLKPGGVRKDDTQRVDWAVVGRLLTTIQSPYTLDDVNSVAQLLNQRHSS